MRDWTEPAPVRTVREAFERVGYGDTSWRNVSGPVEPPQYLVTARTDDHERHVLLSSYMGRDCVAAVIRQIEHLKTDKSE